MAQSQVGFYGKALIPNGDVVVDGLGLQQGEVDVHPMPRWYGDEPHAVLQDWVLIWESRGINGAILRGHIISTRS